MTVNNPEKGHREVYCALLSTHALSIMEKHMPQLPLFLENIKKDAERHGCYPDGTLLFEGGDSFHRLWNGIRTSRLQENGVPTPNLLERGIWQPNGYGGLKEFTNDAKSYMLFYTRDYREHLGELDLSVAFPSMWACPTNDYNIKDLQLSVAFKRKASSKIQESFLRCLEKYFSSVSKEGMLNEGPLKLASPEVVFRGRLAQFRIDASCSGRIL